MSWASRRRNLYLTTFGAISFITLALLSVLFFSTPPTCTDGKKNGTETGIDCGGSCARLCPNEASAPVVRWSRSFEVKPGLWSAVAYVENHNKSVGVRSARYAFKLFDAENVIVAIKEGETQLAPDSITAVFYANIPTGSRVPVRTFFEFTDDLTFERMAVVPSPLRVAQSRLENETSIPRLTAQLENATSGNLPAQLVTAIIYDVSGNAVGASQTILPAIPRGGVETAVFTWPQPFSGAPSRSEIVPIIPLPKGL